MNKRVEKIKNTISNLLVNLIRLLKLAWRADRSLTLGFYGTSALGAFFPIFASYIYKIFIDQLVHFSKVSVSVPVILIFLLGSRYVVNVVWDFVMWGMKNIYFQILFNNKIQNALNYKFYKKLSNLDIAHLEDSKTQDLIGKASDTFTWRPMNFLRNFSYLFNNAVSFIVSFVILIPFGWNIPVILSLITIPRFLLRARFGKVEWSIYGSGAPEARKLWYFRRILSDRVSVIETRIFQSQKLLLRRFKKIQEYLFDLNKKPVIDYVKIAVFPKFFEGIVIFIFAYLKLPEVVSGQMSIGNFTFLISLLDRLSESAGDMVLNLGEMYEENLYVNHYYDVLDLPRLINEPLKPIHIPKTPYPPKIEFRNVSFKYPGSRRFVLRNINFLIDSAQNVAIVGPNGAGKTTLVKLLCRFYDVTDGEILINNINIKNLNLNEWYSYLSTLFQQFVHYNFTVRENIILGNPNVIDESRIIDSAKKSGADYFINKLPEKYSQLLGRQFEGGIELSQGQWQELAIARAFYQSAPILILDEPTSAVDAEGEYKIFRNLNKYYLNKTLFLISHRFSTVRMADKILVLDKGLIQEYGSHDELMVKKGIYASLFRLQARAYQ